VARLGRIEEKLRAAAISGFVIVLYNCWRDYERAIDVIREERADDVPVGIFNDAGRGAAGRNLDDETHTITTLGAATEHDDEVGGMGTSILVGTHETNVWENDHGNTSSRPRRRVTSTTSNNEYGQHRFSRREYRHGIEVRRLLARRRRSDRRCRHGSQCGASSGPDSSSSSSCGASKSEKTDEKVKATVEDFEGDPGSLLAVGLGPGQPEA